MKIAINLIATNRYLYFLKEIVHSIDQYFFTESEISVIIHTNLEIPEDIGDYPRLKLIKNTITHEPWPFTTLRRFDYFLRAKDLLDGNDYCFYIDVDSIFIRDINEHLLPSSGIIGTIHPGLYFGNGTPDRNPESKAFIPTGSNNRYFCGGFFGGSFEAFIKMSETIKSNIEDDLSRGVMAIWHDESHLNRYLYDNPPGLTLEHPFAIAEGAGLAKESTRIVFIDKSIRGGHDFFRAS
jgi:hypothetical protein